MEESNLNRNSNSNDREAQFLASQKARLSKLHDIQSREDDANVQSRRKEFWKSFKVECKDLNDRLSTLVHVDQDSVSGGSEAETVESESKSAEKVQFVTSQQRNEALEKLQQIQRSIVAMNHYTLRSTKFSHEEAKFLSKHFATNEMPELPQADLRLLNIEIQSLKSQTKDIQQIIIPKEKFRFKRYHALLLEKSNLGVPMFEDDEDLVETTTEEEKDGPADDDRQLAFDGLTLSDRKDCIIVVQRDGIIVLKDLKHQVVDTIVPSNILLAAKAFLIRDVVNCQIQM